MDAIQTSYTYRGEDAKMLFDELLDELRTMQRLGMICVHWDYAMMEEGSTHVHRIPYRQEIDDYYKYGYIYLRFTQSIYETSENELVVYQEFHFGRRLIKLEFPLNDSYQGGNLRKRFREWVMIAFPISDACIQG